MLKVILVYDETLVKIGLKSLVNWEELGFQIVAEASDGEGGLELIHRYSPDLVITDIVMPKKNGIEMLREARESYTEMMFVVLSSYDEFDLVKKAMKYGAWDYLLKLNITKESMTDMLMSIQNQIMHSKKILDSSHEPKTYDVQSTALMRQEFLRSIIDNNYKGKNYVKTKLSMINMKLDEKNLVLGMIKTGMYPFNSKYTDEDGRLLDFMIIELLSEIGNEFFSSYFLKWSFGIYVMVLSIEPSMSLNENRENISTMCNTMIEMLRKYVNIEISISISDVYNDYLCLPNAFEQAQNAMEELFYVGFGNVIFFNDKKQADIPFEHIDQYDFKDELPKAIELCDITTIQRVFSDFIEKIKDRRICKNEIYQICNQIVCLCDLCLGGVELKEEAEKQNSILQVETVYSIHTIKEVVEWLECYKGKVIRQIKKERFDEQHILVSRAQKYIASHYLGPTNLKDVANYLNISSGYLSSIFPKYTGLCFTDYVNKVKVQEAERLLREGQHKIYEISYMLGYDNACYFSKIFKRKTGISPTEFIKVTIK